MKNEVVVYGKPNCPFCNKAKNILDMKGIQYKYIDVSVDLHSKDFLVSEGHRTVPQIYVDGVYHGESDSAKTIEVI